MDSIKEKILTLQSKFQGPTYAIEQCQRLAEDLPRTFKNGGAGHCTAEHAKQLADTALRVATYCKSPTSTLQQICDCGIDVHIFKQFESYTVKLRLGADRQIIGGSVDPHLETALQDAITSIRI